MEKKLLRNTQRINGEQLLENSGNVIVDVDWNRLAYNKNFLELLKTPIFDDKSFYDRIDEILFEE